MEKFSKLFIPGPTHVSDDILDVLSTPQIGHRTPEISELIRDEEISLPNKKFFKVCIFMSVFDVLSMFSYVFYCLSLYYYICDLLHFYYLSLLSYF